MKTRKLTLDERDKALRKLLDGGTVQTVAEAFGVSARTIARIKSEAGVARPKGVSSSRSIAVRLSSTEVEALEDLKARHGLASNSEAIRTLVRAASGMLEFDPEAAAQLEEIQGDLRKIGVNVNQVALAANRGRVDLMKTHWDAVNELRQTLPSLRRFLQGVVDEQRRRGVRLFAKWIEGQRD